MYKFLCGHKFSFLLSIYPQEIAGLYDNSHLMIQGSQISSQSEVPFYNPTSGVRFSTSLSTLAIIGLFDSSHPTDYQRVPLKVCK